MLSRRCLRASAQARHRLDHSAFDEAFDDSADGGNGCGKALAPQHRSELILAPPRVTFTQPFNGENELGVTLLSAGGVGLGRFGGGSPLPAVEVERGLPTAAAAAATLSPLCRVCCQRATASRLSASSLRSCASRRDAKRTQRYMTRCKPRICMEISGFLGLPDPNPGDLRFALTGRFHICLNVVNLTRRRKPLAK